MIFVCAFVVLFVALLLGANWVVGLVMRDPDLESMRARRETVLAARRASLRARRWQ